MESRPPGRARSEEARMAILHATCDLLAEDGYERLAIEHIAARAGVGKQTVYRWWRSKADILAECVLEGLLLPQGAATAHADDVRGSMETWLAEILAYLANPRDAAVLRGLIAASLDNPQLGDLFYDRLGAPIQSALAGWITLAGQEGRLRSDVSAEAVIELVLGALLYRVIIGQPIDAASGEALLDVILRGIGAAQPS